MTDSKQLRTHQWSAIAWVLRNPIAATLLMLFMLLGGLLRLPEVDQEVYPEFQLPSVTVELQLPGAAPAEVERTLLAVEQATNAVPGVTRISSFAKDGRGTVTAELDGDPEKILADVQRAIDRITSFPANLERPTVKLAEFRAEVITVVVYGDRPPEELRLLAEQVRKDLRSMPSVSDVVIRNVPQREVSIEVPRAILRRYSLSLDQIAESVQAAALDTPAGHLQGNSNDLLLRTTGRKSTEQDFENLVLRNEADGVQLRLGEIAEIRDGFESRHREALFNGSPAVVLAVYRAGKQKVTELSSAVRSYVDARQRQLPAGVGITTWLDTSEELRDRFSLFLRNGTLGLALVLLLLGVFLDLRLAFWVALGIPSAFCCAVFFFPELGVSLNLMSLFAFVVALGMVVDDSIIVVEGIFTRMGPGVDPMQATLLGVREVAMPVIISTLTTCIFFVPLMRMPGVMGRILYCIPIVVIMVLIASLLEALLVLPSHVAKTRAGSPGHTPSGLRRKHLALTKHLERLIERVGRPTITFAVHHRYITLSLSLALLLVTVGYIAGGHIGFRFLPPVEADLLQALVVLPVGTSIDETRAVQRKLVAAAHAAARDLDGDGQIRGVFSLVGADGGGWRGTGEEEGTHLCTVSVLLSPLGQRKFRSSEFASLWKDHAGEIQGAHSARFQYEISAARPAFSVELSHPDPDALQAAASRLGNAIRTQSGVENVDDGFAYGKDQLELHLTDQGRGLGLTESLLGTQVRAAFYGAEALRLQRYEGEARVMVRLPKAERRSIHDVEHLPIRTPSGGEIPLSQVASVSYGQTSTDIVRRGGRRVVTVTAGLATGENLTALSDHVLANALPQLQVDYPALAWSFGRERAELFAGMRQNFLFALAFMMAILAISLRSYTKTLLIISVIPFGLVGTLFGHVLLDHNISIPSFMGLIAASGVVVNTSLVLVVAIEDARRRTLDKQAAVVEASVRRCRPVLLTSLTTFIGLAPLVFETSMTASLVIPMAISLSFGVLFAALITLLFVPASYVVMSDAVDRISMWLGPPAEPAVEPQEIAPK